jgi:predicted DNA-binding transcriptional regulator YafY
MPRPPEPVDLPGLLARLVALCDALRAGPLSVAELSAQLGEFYPPGESARRMLRRDRAWLAGLGIQIDTTPTRPPRYVLRGGPPHWSADELRTLALIRDTFGDAHPQSAQVQALLERLTGALRSDQQAEYERRAALHTPIETAIDYTPYHPLIAQLERALSRRRMLRFNYHSRTGEQPVLHTQVEPFDIELHDRHLYLVAYTHLWHTVVDFRIDRIAQDAAFQILPTLAPPRTRRLITFRYRLDAALTRGGVSKRFEQQQVIESLPNGNAIIEAQGRSAFFIVRTLLKYAGGAELLEPDWLRAQMVEEVRRLAGVYLR